MNSATREFFESYWKPGMMTVYTEAVSPEMMAGPVEEDGWFKWQLVEGKLPAAEYTDFEEAFKLKLPPSFIDWHQAYFFCDGDCVLVRLPSSLPGEPLASLFDEVRYGGSLVDKGLYPFAADGADVGSLVFDARVPVADNEFPVRLYDHEGAGELSGLGEIIFSSFTKLLECLTYFLSRPENMASGEAVKHFIEIDPLGAGGPGRVYWLNTWGKTKWLNKRTF